MIVIKFFIWLLLSHMFLLLKQANNIAFLRSPIYVYDLETQVMRELGFGFTFSSFCVVTGILLYE